MNKYLIWIKVPNDMPQEAMVQMSDILSNAFKSTDYGFFIVPEKFDIMSRVEVKEWLESCLQELNSDALKERMK
jgi:hypothetical protein